MTPHEPDRIMRIEQDFDDLKTQMILMKDEHRQFENRVHLILGNLHLNLKNLATMTNTVWVDNNQYDPTSHK